ncbi:ribonuclease H-like domain-containing protein [Tanacetum coccineum]
MVTRFRVGTNHDAFNDPNWQNAMCDKYNALIKNNTWTLVPLLMDANVVSCMWLFHHKYFADDTLSHYKAHLVANGNTQLEGIDVDETFSSVFKPAPRVSGLCTSRLCLFIAKGTDTTYLLLYVDDIVLTASSKTLL